MYTATFFEYLDKQTTKQLPRTVIKAETLEQCDDLAFDKWLRRKYSKPGRAITYVITDENGIEYISELNEKYALFFITENKTKWIKIKKLQKLAKMLY